MCEVCRFTECGDIPQDREELIRHYAGDISGNTVYLTGMICNSPRPLLAIEIEVGGHTFIEKNVVINFCPVCGKNLEEG